MTVSGVPFPELIQPAAVLEDRIRLTAIGDDQISYAARDLRLILSAQRPTFVPRDLACELVEPVASSWQTGPPVLGTDTRCLPEAHARLFCPAMSGSSVAAVKQKPALSLPKMGIGQLADCIALQ